MTDDPTKVFRSYTVINCGTLTPTEANWQALINAAKTQPFCAGILALARASQNYISAGKRSYGTGQELKNTLVTFEIDEADKTAALALLDQRATADGCAGNYATELAGVLQFEIRAAATSLGYTPTQASKLTVTLVNSTGCWDRDCAIQAVQAYLVTNDAVWHAPA